MAGGTQVISVALKELRELLRRPLLVAILILGPLAIMLAFGVGSDQTWDPPRAIVVVPPGEEEPRLLRDYQRQLEGALSGVEYTKDLEYARGQLRRGGTDAVLILPEAPFETIAGGDRARIRVLYNELDPARRPLVPQFVRAMAGDINREMFLQNAGEQQEALAASTRELDLALSALDRAIAAAERGNRDQALRAVREVQGVAERLEGMLELLGPGSEVLGVSVERASARLAEGEAWLARAEKLLATPDPRPPSEQLGLAQTRDNLTRLREALERFTSVPPEVAISPLAVEAEFTARLQPDVVTYFAPAMLALLIQHTAVSLGALALVRERLADTFQLYAVAPVTSLQLLLGKYVAYTLFTLVIGGVLLAALLGPFGVPVFGDPWRLALALFLLALTSVGLCFALSLLAATERQAVQFALLALLALPIDALSGPALAFAYALPATYGADVLQDVMLRGLPGNALFLGILTALSGALFLACLGLLRWRTSPR